MIIFNEDYIKYILRRKKGNLRPKYEMNLRADPGLSERGCKTILKENSVYCQGNLIFIWRDDNFAIIINYHAKITQQPTKSRFPWKLLWMAKLPAMLRFKQRGAKVGVDKDQFWEFSRASLWIRHHINSKTYMYFLKTYNRPPSYSGMR